MTTLTVPTPPSTRTPRRPVRWHRVRRALPAWIGIPILLTIGLYPIAWLFLSSFKTQREFTQGSTFALPETFNFQNYIDAWTTGDIARNFLNSVIVTVPSLAVVLVFGVGAAFAIEVMWWKGSNLALLLFVSGIMIPGQMILIPLFITYFNLGISGTYLPMIITYSGLGMPLTVFMMAAYFRSVPREIFEAATIDGASMLRSFFSIGLPMVRNSLFTIGLVQFLSIWNDLLIAMTFTTNSDLRPIQAGLLAFSGEYGQVNYGPLFAGICINVFGLLVLFIVLNRQVMKGLAGGAVKG